MSAKLLLLFAVTELSVCLIPGPAVLVVASQSIRGGFRASLGGVLGVLSGNAIYFALSAIGLGALLMTSAALFQIIKYCGAAYLIIVGVKMLISRWRGLRPHDQIVAPAPMRLFSQGLITQLSNPKAIVFFTALLPQFMTRGESMPEQFVALGLISIAVEFPVLVAYGWAAEQGGRFLPEKSAFLPERIAGLVLVGAGVGLATLRKN